MRPYVAQAQKLPPGAPRLANPKTTLGIKTFHTVLKIGTTRAAQKIGGKLFSPPAEDIDLPDYSRAQ